MDPISVTLVAVLLSIVAYIVHFASKKNQFWAERGIPHPKPLLFLGNSAPFLFMQKPFGEVHYDIAKEFPNEPIVGLYDFMKPVLMIKEDKLIEKILIKDFMHFTDRGFPLDRRNAFDISLFTLTGKEWRAVRYKLAPLFTTNKLKHMFEAMADCGDQLTTVVDSKHTEDMEMKEILGRFAMDVIGSCAFGIEAINLSQPDNQFHRMGKKAFEVGIWQAIKFTMLRNFPKFSKMLRLSFNRRDVAEYFCKIIKDTVEYRKRNNVNRNDFLQLLMILKEKGSVELQIKDPADDYLKMEPTYSAESFEINEDMMIGHAFTFLRTGFEPTASTTMFALYELAKSPEIQDKVRKEILKQVELAGAITYDAIRQMTYLEQCVKETLRKYPPAPALLRVCTKDYTLPNGFTIDEGQSILIPIRAVHYDTRYFPEPDDFRPERFDIDQRLPPCAYIPFGNGPRICIAMRFALMEINYCLAKLLMNYEFQISPKTKPLQFGIKSFITSPKYPILFNVTKISNAT